MPIIIMITNTMKDVITNTMKDMISNTMYMVQDLCIFFHDH